MSFAAIISNTVAVAKAAGFVEADNRRSIYDAPLGGVDRHFQVDESSFAETTPWLGIPQNRRQAQVTVRVVYFAAGGDSGGAAQGGDMSNVNARAVTDMITLSQWLTNPARYDAQNTRINRVIDPNWSWNRGASKDQSAAWDLSFTVEWEQGLAARVPL